MLTTLQCPNDYYPFSVSVYIHCVSEFVSGFQLYSTITITCFYRQCVTTLPVACHPCGIFSGWITHTSIKIHQPINKREWQIFENWKLAEASRFGIGRLDIVIKLRYYVLSVLYHIHFRTFKSPITLLLL